MLAITGGDVVTPERVLTGAVLLIEGGRISGIVEQGKPLRQGARALDASGCLVMPGFIDTHVHGNGGEEFMTPDPAGVQRMARRMCRYGVTGFLATTIAAGHEETLAAIRSCWAASREQRPGARLLGIHLEGPYLNLKRKGAQPAEGIRNPDLAQCREYLEAAPGLIRSMTLAPELPGGDALIRLLVEHNVAVSMGHTDATYEQAMHAIETGASRATHLFNQMSPIHHRAPGTVAACLNDPQVTTELITDGVHLSPAIVRLAVGMKGADRICLITDAISALGLPEGDYNLGPHPVHVEDGRCTLADGTLAGSVHRMDRAVLNTMEFSGCSLVDACRMAATVPARVAGVSDRKGAITPGYDADLALMREGEVELTMIEGEVVYQRAA